MGYLCLKYYERMDFIMIENEVLKCILERRSTRQFIDQQISHEQLDTILEAAIWAPSGGNNQTWLFTAIQNVEALQHLSVLVRDAFRVWEPDDDYASKRLTKERAQKDDYHFFFHAPTLIIASNRPDYQNAMADCSLAMENIFLAAHSLGLGSCYINQLFWLRNEPVIRDFLVEFGVPKENVICNSAAIGHIAAKSAAPARKPGTIYIVR